jgi:Tfp pilus assembly protein PilV
MNAPAATRSPRDRGQTIIEAVVAMLIVMVAAGSVMGVLVTGKESAGRTVRRAQAAQAVQTLAEALKAYQTADTAAAPGPGPAGTANGWGLPGDACGCAAFSAGPHALNPAVWAPNLAAQGGKISYTVAATATPLGPQPSVSFDVAWTEP